MIEAQPFPTPQSFLAAYDQAARDALKEAQREVEPIVLADTPHRSGQLAHALKPTVRRVATGQALTIGVPRGKPHVGSNATIAQVARWVQRGTGEYRVEGPGKRGPIRSRSRRKRLRLPGRPRWQVRGQHPNPFMVRIRDHADPRVEAAMARGAEAGNRLAERLFG